VTGTVPRMGSLADRVDELAARERFSGVVRVDRPGDEPFVRAYGSADRRHGIPNTVETRFTIASGTKGLTALTVVSLIEDGTIDRSTTARSILGSDLPLIDDAVTVEHLLAHRSGIGDYFDESTFDDTNAYLMPVPVHALDSTEAYLRVLDGFPQVSAPGERFAYNNGGFVVLALIAERASGVPFERLIRERVCDPAGMHATAFLRSDELPANAAIGYLSADGERTNVHHLPVLGTGDGGIFTTAGDVAAFWDAFIAGRIVSESWVAEMVRPRSDWPEEHKRYGLGFHLHETRDVVWLEGSDAGVSFASTYDPSTRTSATMISNVSDAWAIALLLDEELGL
jgi:CubicO group peptidase (beta-lactamase class C family)